VHLGRHYDSINFPIPENAIYVSFGHSPTISNPTLRDYHTMAILSDNSLWGWGSNRLGQIGSGIYGHHPIPIKIMDDVVSVSTTNWLTMAVRSDGSLWAWGHSNRPFWIGQREHSVPIADNVPVRIMENVASVSVASVSMGTQHSVLVIMTDGSLWRWRDNWHGQLELGDGTSRDRLGHVHIMDNVAAVSAGRSHTMAIQTDGSLWAWGDNRNGQLGDGTTERRDSPVHIMDNVVAVSAGGDHTMALQADGSLWAWGANAHGRLGDGTTENRHSPVHIMDNVKLIGGF
jgi:alpha-tubulin suppressor-like RCC1 family protein